MEKGELRVTEVSTEVVPYYGGPPVRGWEGVAQAMDILANTDISGHEKLQPLQELVRSESGYRNRRSYREYPGHFVNLPFWVLKRPPGELFTINIDSSVGGEDAQNFLAEKLGVKIPERGIDVFVSLQVEHPFRVNLDQVLERASTVVDFSQRRSVKVKRGISDIIHTVIEEEERPDTAITGEYSATYFIRNSFAMGSSYDGAWNLRPFILGIKEDMGVSFRPSGMSAFHTGREGADLVYPSSFFRDSTSPLPSFHPAMLFIIAPANGDLAITQRQKESMRRVAQEVTQAFQSLAPAV